MTEQQEVIAKLKAALPGVREWINAYLAKHVHSASKVSSSGFQRLTEYYPADLLARSHSVNVPRVQFPPLAELGLPGFSAMEEMALGGITFLDTFFVIEHRESLFFHELVHVVQWNRLGMDKFLMAYGIGHLQGGYEKNPLEQMAYEFQEAFEEGRPLSNLVSMIERQTDEFWSRVAPLIA